MDMAMTHTVCYGYGPYWVQNASCMVQYGYFMAIKQSITFMCVVLSCHCALLLLTCMAAHQLHSCPVCPQIHPFALCVMGGVLSVLLGCGMGRSEVHLEFVVAYGG